MNILNLPRMRESVAADVERFLLVHSALLSWTGFFSFQILLTVSHLLTCFMLFQPFATIFCLLCYCFLNVLLFLTIWAHLKVEGTLNEYSSASPLDNSFGSVWPTSTQSLWPSKCVSRSVSRQFRVRFRSPFRTELRTYQLPSLFQLQQWSPGGSLNDWRVLPKNFRRLTP